MTRKPLVLAGLCIALLAAPAFAQRANPAGGMPTPGMTQPGPSKSKAATTGHKVRHVAQAAHTRSCWDLAWESQAMKSCFAKHPEQASQHPQAAQMLNPSGGTSGNRY